MWAGVRPGPQRAFARNTIARSRVARVLRAAGRRTSAAFLTSTGPQGYEGERMRALALAIALGAAANAAAAPSVTLNGVSIDGATGQRFENCTVVIDERGNVHITAKGYAVKPLGDDGATRPAPRPAADARATPAQGKLTRRYFVATEHAEPGTQYDLAIFINAQWIREVKATEPQVVLEITRYLRPGANKVVLAATKRIQGERLSTSRDVALKIVVGEGNVGGDHVMIDNPLVEMTRTAAEVEDRTEEFVVEAR